MSDQHDQSPEPTTVSHADTVTQTSGSNVNTTSQTLGADAIPQTSGPNADTVRTCRAMSPPGPGWVIDVDRTISETDWSTVDVDEGKLASAETIIRDMLALHDKMGILQRRQYPPGLPPHR